MILVLPDNTISHCQFETLPAHFYLQTAMLLFCTYTYKDFSTSFYTCKLYALFSNVSWQMYFPTKNMSGFYWWDFLRGTYICVQIEVNFEFFWICCYFSAWRFHIRSKKVHFCCMDTENLRYKYSVYRSQLQTPGNSCLDFQIPYFLSV